MGFFRLIKIKELQLQLSHFYGTRRYAAHARCTVKGTFREPMLVITNRGLANEIIACMSSTLSAAASEQSNKFANLTNTYNSPMNVAGHAKGAKQTKYAASISQQKRPAQAGRLARSSSSSLTTSIVCSSAHLAANLRCRHSCPAEAISQKGKKHECADRHPFWGMQRRDTYASILWLPQ